MKKKRVTESARKPAVGVTLEAKLIADDGRIEKCIGGGTKVATADKQLMRGSKCCSYS